MEGHLIVILFALVLHLFMGDREPADDEYLELEPGDL